MWLVFLQGENAQILHVLFLTTCSGVFCMEFAGIITEYDPFHNGHAAQIAAAKSAGAGCVAVCMSSGAVQRGGVPY